jgi:hypothetical protein
LNADALLDGEQEPAEIDPGGRHVEGHHGVLFAGRLRHAEARV